MKKIVIILIFTIISVNLFAQTINLKEDTYGQMIQQQLTIILGCETELSFDDKIMTFTYRNFPFYLMANLKDDIYTVSIGSYLNIGETSSQWYLLTERGIQNILGDIEIQMDEETRNAFFFSEVSFNNNQNGSQYILNCLEIILDKISDSMIRVMKAYDKRFKEEIPRHYKK